MQKKKPLPVVRPGSQSRRFTHIFDTIEICFKAWKNDKCRYHSISNKKSYSILEVAKLFKAKIKYLPPRKGERFASALTDMSLSNKVYKNFGKTSLKKYVDNFIRKNNGNF
jgi:UDP-glucose 4-epimerase